MHGRFTSQPLCASRRHDFPLFLRSPGGHLEAWPNKFNVFSNGTTRSTSLTCCERLFVSSILGSFADIDSKFDSTT